MFRSLSLSKHGDIAGGADADLYGLVRTNCSIFRIFASWLEIFTPWILANTKSELPASPHPNPRELVYQNTITLITFS